MVNDDGAAFDTLRDVFLVDVMLLGGRAPFPDGRAGTVRGCEVVDAELGWSGVQ